MKEPENLSTILYSLEGRLFLGRVLTCRGGEEEEEQGRCGATTRTRGCLAEMSLLAFAPRAWRAHIPLVEHIRGLLATAGKSGAALLRQHQRKALIKAGARAYPWHCLGQRSHVAKRGCALRMRSGMLCKAHALNNG